MTVCPPSRSDQRSSRSLLKLAPFASTASCCSAARCEVSLPPARIGFRQRASRTDHKVVPEHRRLVDLLCAFDPLCPLDQFRRERPHALFRFRIDRVPDQEQVSLRRRDVAREGGVIDSCELLLRRASRCSLCTRPWSTWEMSEVGEDAMESRASKL